MKKKANYPPGETKANGDDTSGSWGIEKCNAEREYNAKKIARETLGIRQKDIKYPIVIEITSIIFIIQNRCI